MLRVVIDTNLWIRALLHGPRTIPVLARWYQGEYEVVCSQELLAELNRVWQRPRFSARIQTQDAQELLERLKQASTFVKLRTTPPGCRDPKDAPVLATAIDGHADAIVTGDADIRADDVLRQTMQEYGIELWGIQTFLEHLAENT